MLRKILPHAAIILSVMYFVFFCIDRVNSAMAFINNDITKWLLVILSAISIYNAVLLIIGDLKNSERTNRKMQNNVSNHAFDSDSAARRSEGTFTQPEQRRIPQSRRIAPAQAQRNEGTSRFGSVSRNSNHERRSDYYRSR